MSKKEKIVLILIFFLFLSVSFLVPISGDDWANYIVGSKGLYNIISNAVGMYFSWEGRFISRLLINICTYNKFIFNILFSFLMVVLIYVISKIIKGNNYYLKILLITISLILINNQVFTQTYLWVAGSITYFFPTVLILLYIYLYYKYLINKNEYKKSIYTIYFLFSFFITMFVENIACAYIFLNIILFIIEYLKNKKVNKLLLGNIIFSVIGFILMIISPGTAFRYSIEKPVFNDYTLFQKFKYNYPNFINSTFIQNKILLILIFISNILIINKFSKNKIIKLILNIYYILSLIFGFVNINLSIITLVYWSIYFIINTVILIKYLNNTNYSFIILTIYLTGIMSNIVMIISPIHSGRTALLTIVFLYTVYINILSELISSIKMTKIEKILEFILILLSILLIISYYNVHKYNKFLGMIIDKQRDNNKIIIYDSPEYLTWGLTPYGEYHIKVFKEYYGISFEKELVVKKSLWKYKIFFDEKAMNSFDKMIK